MPILDATEIQDENELQQEPLTDDQVNESIELNGPETSAAIELGPVRSITLDPPADYETAIVLLIRHDSDNRYRSGIQITRHYETTPHEQVCDEQPDLPDGDQGYATLGEAVAAVAESADEWVSYNSDDKDERADAARLYLQGWIDEFDAETVTTDAIFDAVPDAEPIADMMTAGEAIAEQTGKPIPTPAVADDAQVHYDKRKHALEERISQLSIEQVRLKAASKSNREAMTEYTQELTELLLRGPERLPLFDRVKPAEVTQEPVLKLFNEPVADAVVKTEAAPVPVADEAWRSATIEDAGIPPAVCKILRENNDIGTLGQLADWGNEFALTDLKKIGPAKAEQIQNATDDYWAKNPRA